MTAQSIIEMFRPMASFMEQDDLGNWADADKTQTRNAILCSLECVNQSIESMWAVKPSKYEREYLPGRVTSNYNKWEVEYCKLTELLNELKAMI